MTTRDTERPGLRAAPRDPRPVSRQILALAVPAFGALLAEPLFLLADTAIIGHLGVAQLAGVGVGTTILHTVTGLMIFLAYSTTPAVSRFMGAGNRRAAMDRGRDGVWLALLLGLALAVAGWVTAAPLAGLIGADGAVQEHAVAYLQWSMPGIPAMLGVLAATGILRGLLDTRTPLIVAGVGFGLNIGLNFLMVYGLGLGVAGSAAGTSIVQWGMFAVYLAVLLPRFRAAGTGLAPSWAGMRATAQVGSWLLLRTASLRVAILATVMAATGLGVATLAAHQLVFTVYSTLAFALDALAIAAQALIGRELGAGRRDEARALTGTMVRWSLWFGLVTGLLLAVLAWALPPLFTPDPAVRAAATAGLLVLAASQPVSGFVFVLDGVLIGAGDARYLALAGVVNLVVYLPALAGLAWLASGAAQGGQAPGAGVQLALLWAGFAGVFMGARAVTLGLRARSDAWMRTGEH
ncbi:MATE family efflux transporter [Micrococcus sp. TA1]|uniref:MATE family efflux transporter n=1 Tax=Micrococcus sp. TA1 TaxID=681627 RepID=UPI00160A5AB1|nr:MATE family efflux transporter [Micrococcus sp. TA1]MBB5750525.1 putative MATE family efflux protein [Micrococcus sp. TA1]